MGNKQQLTGKDQVLNPQNFMRHLNINGDQSFDTKADSQNTTRVNTTGHNDTNSTNNQESGSKLSSPKSKRKKKDVLLSKNPNQRETQVFKAKKDYEKKKLQNQTKLAEIRQKIETYNKIYRQNDEQKQVNIHQQQKQEEVIIWGKKVKMRKGNPMQLYYQYRYPKQPLKIGEQDDEYTNWQKYKTQMSKGKFKQLQQEQQQLLDEEQQLKQRYESLVKQRNQLKNQSRFFPKDNQNSNIEKLLQESTLQNDLNEDKHDIVTPSFKHAEKIPYVQQTPLNKKRKIQPNTASTQEKVSLFFTEQPINVIDDWVHPQNIINSDPQYYAKQMHFYQLYLRKKRSNYVSVQFIDLQQQYPAKRQVFTKPVRTQQTIVDPYLQKLQRKRRRKNGKSKPKSKSKSKSKVLDESTYTKVYEKIPRKRSSSFKSPEQRFKAISNFYPYQDSKTTKARASRYPSQIQVNDSTRKRKDDEETLYFHYISKQDDNNREWVIKNNSNVQVPDGENEKNHEKEQARRRISYQRQMQWQILQKVRIKNL